MNTYSLQKADAWLADVAKTSREAAIRGLLSAGLRTINHITTSIIPDTKPMPVNRGAYRAGWRTKKIDDGCIIYNSVPYASIIENGARAANIKIGRAMIDALTEWVRMKGIGGRTVAKGKRVVVIKASEDEARKIAWAIAKSMMKKGIFNGGNGLKVLERAMKMSPLFIKQEVAREIAREIKK